MTETMLAILPVLPPSPSHGISGLSSGAIDRSRTRSSLASGCSSAGGVLCPLQQQPPWNGKFQGQALRLHSIKQGNINIVSATGRHRQKLASNCRKLQKKAGETCWNSVRQWLVLILCKQQHQGRGHTSPAGKILFTTAHAPSTALAAEIQKNCSNFRLSRSWRDPAWSAYDLCTQVLNKHNRCYCNFLWISPASRVQWYSVP